MDDPRVPDELFLDYDLPQELIAQTPIEPRDASQLLVLDRASGSITDRRFSDLPELLDSGDLLVVNNSKVIPARIAARRKSGGSVELLLLERRAGTCWEALARPLSRLRPGEMLDVVADDGSATDHRVRFAGRKGSLAIIDLLDERVVDQHGSMPLPPYIHKRLEDGERYQTVYSEEPGSAAAPTAGLHFTPRLLEHCRGQGIECAELTLHVGVDTFRSLDQDDPADHRMHSEWFSIPEHTWQAIMRARDEGRRVVSVGTTVTRVLETVADPDWSDGTLTGRTSKFIRPPYEFRVAGAQITNFHLPRTTLLLMIGAFAGSGLLREAYEHAVRRRYRFYSFGDAMLIV
ncbi:tRNA preQ1(34) S-adenosylmethionine ribosyltransferase-isomerase QueA [soil metagenome]